MEAEYLFFNRLLGRDKADLERRVVERLLALQQPDGSWPLHPGGPGDLSTTAEAYLALVVTGTGPDEPALTRARDFVLGQGGLARARVFTRIWLALFGQFPWKALPTLPVELVLLPPWAPMSTHAMASWTRLAVIPLTLLLAERPVLRIPAAAHVETLWARPPRASDLTPPRTRELVTAHNLFLGIDRTLARLERLRWRPLRRRAVARAIEWILRHQERNGQWGGIQTPLLLSPLALHAVGFALDHPTMVSAVQGTDDLLIECEGTLCCQPSVTPVRDTAWAVCALLEAGTDPAHPALVRAGEWLLAQQIFRAGDWAVARPRLEPGGWALEFANDCFPDVDDSAVVLTALGRLPAAGTPAGRRALAYGLNWVLGMQGRRGGWGAYDADNDADYLNRIPFADFGAMTDPPTEDVTGRVLALMGSSGYGTDFGRARRALEFVRRAQRPDGPWWGRWGVNFLYGTWSVLEGVAAIGEDLRAPWVRRAVEWVRAHQNADGGFGESCASYADETQAGRGESTASQTAWAVLALLAADGPHGAAVERAIDYLVRTQGPDGTWAERAFTGTAFPRHLYLRYHLHRHIFPLLALSRFRRLAAG